MKSLDITHFSTSKAKNMDHMFSRCRSLSSLDLSNFDTSNVNTAYKMFEECLLLTSLILSNFNTSSIENMHGMFVRCEKLTSLDLNNFDTSKVTDMEYMFAGCLNLKYIELKNMIIQNDAKFNKLIDNSLINPSIKIDDTSSFNKAISTYDCNNVNCSEYIDIFSNNKNLCIEGCLLSQSLSNNFYEICS